MNALLFLQSFFQKLSQTLMSLLKIVLWSRPVKIPRNQGKELLILGNGPSLKPFFQEHLSFLQNKKIWAVNHFADTDVYTKIQPNYYVINVPEFWTDNADFDVIEKRNKLINSIISKTNWQMTLLLGKGAKRSAEWKAIAQKKANIKLVYFNVTPIEGFQFFRHFCYKKQIGMPRPHNVLVPSLMIGMYMNFKKIYIIGADHSWMQDLFVAEDNTVYLTQKHFYDAQTAKPDVMKKMGKGQRKMHEILHKFMLSFRGYFDIEEYAKKRNIEIINITPGSFIDAFKRMKL